MNAVVGFVVAAGVLGDDPAPAAEKPSRSALVASTADSYRFSDEPDSGEMFLWTRDGRPAVGTCVYTYGQNRFDQEMVSLQPRTLVGRRADGRVWAPETAGVEFAAIPGAPVPANMPSRRLVQMRALARGFSGVIVRADGSEFALRLIAQPFLRYGTDDGSVRDGALFGFSLGTDPEALVMIEARPEGEEGVLRWEFALTRMTTAGVRIEFGEDVVYEVGRRRVFTIVDDPYNTFRGSLPAPADTSEK